MTTASITCLAVESLTSVLLRCGLVSKMIATHMRASEKRLFDVGAINVRSASVCVSRYMSNENGIFSRSRDHFDVTANLLIIIELSSHFAVKSLGFHTADKQSGCQLLFNRAGK